MSFTSRNRSHYTLSKMLRDTGCNSAIHGDVKNQMDKNKPTNLKIRSAERNKSVYGYRLLKKKKGGKEKKGKS